MFRDVVAAAAADDDDEEDDDDDDDFQEAGDVGVGVSEDVETDDDAAVADSVRVYQELHRSNCNATEQQR